MAIPLSAGRLQFGVDQNNFGICPFLNWARMRVQTSIFASLRKTDNSTISGTALFDQGRVDANYNLIDISGCNQFEQYIFLPVGAMAGTSLADVSRFNMVMTWEGDAVTGILTARMSNVVVDVPNKRVTFKFTYDAAGNAATFRFTLNPALGGGPTNIKVFRAEHEALLNSGQIMDPDWLDWYARGCGRIRFMDPCNANASPVAAITDIPTLDYRFWGNQPTITSGQKSGWPLECYIETANLTGLQVWVNIPHGMSDAGVTALAEAFRDGIDWDGNEVRVIFEVSNEPWNSATGFTQTTGYYQPGGAAQGWTTGSAQNKGCQYYGYRAAQMMELVRAAFGTNSGVKWAGALNCQAVQSSTSTATIQGVTRHITNDVGAVDAVNRLFSLLTVACYFGQTFISALVTDTIPYLQAQWALVSTENFMQRLYDVLKIGGTEPVSGFWGSCDELSTSIAAHKVIADANGLTMDFYEGGLHGQISNPLLGNFSGQTYGTLLNDAYRDFSNDARCGQITYDWYEALIAANPGSKPAQYVGVSSWRSGSFFSAYQTTQDYSRERGNACQAVNLGIPYQPGKRNMRAQLTA